MAVSIAASAEGLSRIMMDGSRGRERVLGRCKQTKENAGSYEASTAACYVARMSPGRLNGRNVVGDMSLLNNVQGT
jgi:hypothetical protein